MEASLKSGKNYPLSRPAHLIWLNGNSSVRHQNWQQGIVQNVARRAAQHEFAKARMAISAHDQKIGVDPNGIVHQKTPYVSDLQRDLMQAVVEIMSREEFFQFLPDGGVSHCFFA